MSNSWRPGTNLTQPRVPKTAYLVNCKACELYRIDNVLCFHMVNEHVHVNVHLKCIIGT